jgi:hypothetical protein
LFLATCLSVLTLAPGAPVAGAQSHNISTVAGDGAAGTGGDGGPATQAQLGGVVGVTVLADGSYLVWQQGGSVLRRVLPDGTITLVAGNGGSGFSGDGGPATSAALNIPSGGAATADGGYLIADTANNRIRRVAPDGNISTVVGNGSGTFGGDGGPASDAQVSFPYDVAVQPDGGYLIADVDNDRIRRVGPEGNISTVAGGGGAAPGDGGPATSAVLSDPSGVAPTADGGYLIADTGNHRVRKVSFDGTITTVAGTGAAGSAGDGAPATDAMLNRPIRVAAEPGGGFVIADSANARVRRVAPDGTISTLAGTTVGYSGDGGPATSAQLNNPFGVAVTAAGDYLIADATNNRVRLVDGDPPPPVLTGSAPVSPSSDNTPRILGTAARGTDVFLYADSACSGLGLGTGTAADLAGPGIPISVAENATTTVFARVADASGNSSPCSTSSVTYVHQTAALPAPVRGRLANAVPQKGRVRVKLPGRSFVALESLGRQVPVGSILDTTKGTVVLTTAGKTPGKTQIGRFSKGVFRFTQTKKNPLTTISMMGANLNACSRLPRGGSPKVTAAATKRRRTLFSDVKGRFRTRGRNSAATVRGTSWTMTDTCNGTLTSVKTGSVLVRDFNLVKTRLVRAGASYLARAPLRKKPGKRRR